MIKGYNIVFHLKTFLNEKEEDVVTLAIKEVSVKCLPHS